MEMREKLADLRKKKGLTQLELAEELQVSRQAVSKWEVGAAVPSREKLNCLAKLYGVPLEYLLREDDQEPEKQEPPREEGKPEGRGMKLLLAWMTVLTLGMMFLCAAVFFLTFSGAKKNEDAIPISELESIEIDGLETGTGPLFPLECGVDGEGG